MLGLEVREENGISHTEWMGMPLQIIESGKLDPEENIWLSSLRRNNKAERVKILMDTISRADDRIITMLGAYLDIVFNASKEAFKEVARSMASQSVLDEMFAELGYKDRERQEGKKETALNLLAMGDPIERVVKATGLDHEFVMELDVQRRGG